MPVHYFHFTLRGIIYYKPMINYNYYQAALSIEIINNHHWLQLLPTTTDCDFYHQLQLPIITNSNYCTTINTNCNYYHSTINNYNYYESIWHSWNYYQSIITLAVYNYQMQLLSTYTDCCDYCKSVIINCNC